MSDIDSTPVETDLRTDLSAAFDAFDAFDAETPAAAATPDAPAASFETPKPEATGERPRAANGQFVAKEQQPVAKAPQDVVTPPSSEPKGAEVKPEAGASEPIRPPASWSAAAKAEFKALPPLIQQEVLKREQDIEGGFAQWQSSAQRLNRLDEILAPRRERIQLAGLNEAQAVQALFAAQDFLERNPVEALLYLGRQAGVDWRNVFAAVQGAPQVQQQPALPPEMASMAQQVQALTQYISQREQSERQQARSRHLGEVQAFAADPKNLYFENVRQQMGQLVRSGMAATLQDAYDQACWSDPTIRGLLQKAQADEAATAAKAKAQQARYAGGSVHGSPSPGASSGGPASKGSVRDDILNAWDAAA